MSLDPPANEPSLLLGLIGFGSIILVAAVVSWLAARYLAWAWAPRRFRLRVATAGALPLCIYVGLIIALNLARGDDILLALARLGRATLIGQLLMLALLLTGMGASWLTASRRKRRELSRDHAAYEIFQ